MKKQRETGQQPPSVNYSEVTNKDKAARSAAHMSGYEAVYCAEFASVGPVQGTFLPKYTTLSKGLCKDCQHKSQENIATGAHPSVSFVVLRFFGLTNQSRTHENIF